MIRKLLIANRGEIACRVIATAQRLGIATVAVYSDADASAKHVGLADQAFRIGPAEAAKSYLNADAILDAARVSGADAIHPGYGFLSENPDFVDAVEAAGLTFVGPPASAIRAMGLKDAAKALMEQAGVPLVPGYHGADQDPALLASEAERIGYPVLIKARAGGGGKGMRKVDRAADFDAALTSAQREAQASFGDASCLVEKYIAQPRHIEIQVFADAHGSFVHLNERDCSLQRRYQKVIEEAPAPNMPASVRNAMGQAAIDAARAVGYVNAGTVEFIVDGSGPLTEQSFWFMEMNTRLQVEHPVSEAITGYDFVELQLRIASGAPLPFSQEDVAIDGWAMEARLYAEDPVAGFLPATGRLDHLHFPQSTAFEHGLLRIDSGVDEGDYVEVWYDPMIAKVITHGPDRETARRALIKALDQIEVAGCETNTEFLSALAGTKEFAKGEVETGLIERNIETLVPDRAPSDLQVALAAVAAAGLLPEDGAVFTGWRAWGMAEHIVPLKVGADLRRLRIALPSPNAYSVEGLEFSLSPKGQHWQVASTGQQFEVGFSVGTDITLFDRGQSYTFGRIDSLARDSADQDGDEMIVAPMPGVVTSISTSAGEDVAKGDVLVALEAMKMEHALRAPRDGRIAEVFPAVGSQVENGAVLVRMEPQDD